MPKNDNVSRTLMEAAFTGLGSNPQVRRDLHKKDETCLMCNGTRKVSPRHTNPETPCSWCSSSRSKGCVDCGGEIEAASLGWNACAGCRMVGL